MTSQDMVKPLTKILPPITPTARLKHKTPVSLRTLKSELNYQKAKKQRTGRPFIDEPCLREWKHWKLINNTFPYSGVFKTHHLLIPKRVVSQKDLSKAERNELDQIMSVMSDENSYDCMIMNFKRNQSIEDHFHLHLLVYKDNRLDIKL